MKYYGCLELCKTVEMATLITEQNANINIKNKADQTQNTFEKIKSNQLSTLLYKKKLRRIEIPFV